MMQIGNVSGSAVQAVKDVEKAAGRNGDSGSQELMSRLASAKSRRQEITSNQKMSEEEKSNERQKIQQEISDLKRELRKRQMEEQKEQKEAEAAARKQEEQEKQARAEVIKEQQGENIRGGERQRDNRGTEAVNDRSQTNKAAENREKRTEELQADGKAEEENRKSQRENARKEISKGAVVEQFRMIRKANQQIATKAQVRAAEIKQDEIRGENVEKEVEAQRVETQKKTRQVEMVEEFMLDGKEKEAAGANNQVAIGLNGRGLYTDRGTMFGNLFPADKMDVQQ